MTRLTGQAWLTAPETLAVLDALEAAGGQARFVGGSVRNALIGRPVDDLDIATDLLPEQVVQALKAAGLKVVPTGIEHGTVTAVSGKRPHEVTTLRRDVETDGRRAVVAFTDDWAEDAARRDFRLNALYADRTGEVFDPTGQGVADALEGRIVFVGDAEIRIREDYLRILRFFRFMAWYGRGEPDSTGLEACARLSEGVERLSAERVSKELLKLLAATEPRPAVKAMAEAGVLTRVLPETGDLALFEAMCGVSADALLRLSALLPADAGVAATVANRLRLSNAQKDRLVQAVAGTVALDLTRESARAALYDIGPQAFEDRLTRAWAAEPDRASEAEDLLELAGAWSRPVFPVTGADLKARGLEPGPVMGRRLAELEAWWIAHDFDDAGVRRRLEAG